MCHSECPKRDGKDLLTHFPTFGRTGGGLGSEPMNCFLNPQVNRNGERVSAEARAAPRVLIRPEPGFYVLRQRHGAPVIPALIYQRCPMVVPQPGTAGGPHPKDWCRPLDRSPVFEAQIDGRWVPVDRVWTARSLRPVSAAEYTFRMGPLRQWARLHPRAPEAAPRRPVDLAALPPLF